MLLTIVDNKYKKIENFNRLELTIALNIFRNSISENQIKIHKFNINYFNDYINYIKIVDSKKILNKILIIVTQKNIKNSYIFNINSYKNLLNKYNNFGKNLNNYIYLNYVNKALLDLNNEFLNNLKQSFKISFSVSTIVKYISNYTVNNSVILYLRKNKIFNKSRYSRNRQTYRTGAYWCLYVNIIAVIAFYFWFYKFSFNFGYIWWILYMFILSFFLPRSLKYKFYNPINFLYELKNGIIWFMSIMLSILINYINFIKLTKKFLLNNLLFKSYQLYFITKLAKINKYDYIYIYQSFNIINSTNKIINNYINKYII